MHSSEPKQSMLFSFTVKKMALQARHSFCSGLATLLFCHHTVFHEVLYLSKRRSLVNVSGRKEAINVLKEFKKFWR